MNRLLAAAIAMLVAGTASAQLYRWVDQNGKVQYGDNPPPGAKVTRLKPPPGPSTPPAEAKKDGEKPLSPEAAFRKRQQDREEAEKKASTASADEQNKRTNCDQARAALRQLQTGQRISTVNAQGERVYLEDDARDRELERTQKAVRDWCPK